MKSTKKNTPLVVKRLKILAHPVRLRIVLWLAQEGPMNAVALIEHLAISQPLLAHYLGQMKAGGVLSSQQQGNLVYYSLTDVKLAKAIEGWLDPKKGPIKKSGRKGVD